jgi:hypothetical protein
MSDALHQNGPVGWGEREGRKYGSTALTVFIQMNKYQIPYNIRNK